MKQRISFLLACVFLCLTGCRASGAEQTFFAMDTVMSVQVSGRRGPQAVAAAREAVERLDDLLSRTDSDSQIARLNTAAGDGAAVAVDPDVAELLAFSQEIARQLPGDFDITIAPVMDAWGFTTEERHVPAPDALAAAMALVDSEELSVDTEASAASLARAGMEVDLGAVAKGFAAREAEAEEFTVENDVMAVRFSTRGGQVTGVTLKDYKRYAPRGEEGRPVEMMDPATARFGMTFYVKNGLHNVDVNTLDYVFEAEPVGGCEPRVPLYALRHGVARARLSGGVRRPAGEHGPRDGQPDPDTDRLVEHLLPEREGIQEREHVYHGGLPFPGREVGRGAGHERGGEVEGGDFVAQLGGL